MNYIVILYFSILMRLPRLSPTRPLGHSGSLKVQQEPGVGLCWLWGAAGTPSRFTHQSQAKPCRCSRWVASIIERIDLGCASDLMGVLIQLTAPLSRLFMRTICRNTSLSVNHSSDISSRHKTTPHMRAEIYNRSIVWNSNVSGQDQNKFLTLL